MSNQLKYGIIGAFLLVAAGLVWLFSKPIATEKVKSNGPAYSYVSSDWSTKYGWDSKDPYGLYLFREGILKRLKNKKRFYTISTPEQFEMQVSKNQKATYIFVGDEFGLTDDEVDSIYTQISDIGSDLMVVSSGMTEYFVEPFELSFDYTNKVEVQTQYADFPLIYLFQNDTIGHEWVVFSHYKDEDFPSKVLSNLNGRPNYMSVEWGEGNVFLNTTPEAIQNYQLNRSEAEDYAKELWKKIDPEKPVYLMEFARLKEKDPYKPLQDVFEKKGKKDDSYLQLLFNTPALRAALLLTLIALLLFIIFRAKRMRPLIPGLPEKRNMSKIFVSTMASIYHTKNNPLTVLKLHKRNFFDTVQKHFFIDLNKRTGEQEIKSLAEKSGYPLAKLEKLIEQLEAIKNVDDLHLFNCVAAKREFYELSGIISEKTQIRIDHQKVEVYKSIWLVFPVLLIGLFIAFFGLWMLVKANNIGILLMILGTAILLLCFRLLGVPTVRYENDTWNIYPLFGKKIKFESQEIQKVTRTTSGFEIVLSNGKIIHMNLQNVDEQKLNVLSSYLHKIKNVES